jgi:type I restriction enzyme S subunit
MNQYRIVKLGDVLKYEQPTKYIVSNDTYHSSYNTPVLTAGKTFLLGYTNETENIFTKTPVIIFDDFTTAIKFVDFPFKVKSSAMKILNPTDDIDIKYMFYLMSTIKSDKGLHKRYWISKYSNIEINLPTLEKQNQIAKTLDKANELIELRKESITKLDALAKSIFIDMFGDPVSNSKKWKTTLLNDIGIWKGGGTPSRTNSDYFSGDIPWITTVSLGNLYIDESNAVELITNEAISKSSTKLIPKNSIIIGTRVGVGKVSINKVGICTNQDIISIINIHKNFNNIFIVFFIKSYNEVLNAFKRGATIQGITSANLKNIDLINPPIELQSKFAKIIEKIEEQKSLYTQELEKLQENFDALLQKSFQ